MKKVVWCVALVTLSCGMAVGANYKVLWSFGGTPNDGAVPVSNLVADGLGNLYGTTEWGGSATTLECYGSGCGTVFKLSPNLDGSWTNTIIYSFCTNPVNNLCLDGQAPLAGLVFDAAGNLYGTTYGGGAQYCSDGFTGCGTVFELSPPLSPGGAWTEAVLYNFCSNSVNYVCLDGFAPSSQLTFDASGNLYSTAGGGSGHIGYGIVFELSPGLSGWTETILYNFCSQGDGNFCLDGANPLAGVTFDQSGNLYGTTELSRWIRGGGGTVYELSPGVGGWTETILHDFADSRNQIPVGTVSFDSSGNLYATTSAGGSGWGGLLRVSPAGTVRSFLFNGTNGSQPLAGVVVDAKTGSVYGTTTGYNTGGSGNVFKIGPKGKETVLHNFCSQTNCADGGDPLASLIQDESGNLYGTTKVGGAFNLGVVFEITP